MSENPYQAPPEFEPAVGVKSGRREDLRSVAIYQKGLLFSILAYLLGYIPMFATISQPPSPELAMLSLAIGIIMLIGAVTGLVFVILLAIKVYNPILGILLVFVMFVPLVNFLVLLSVNRKATNILKTNGIRVGFMGAKLSEVN